MSSAGPGRLRAPIALGVLLHAGFAVAQTPQGTAFTYQGRLSDAGLPADGAYDFRFILYDAAVGGSQVGPIVTRDDVVTTGGLFTVSLDFGASFAASRRFLDLSVRPGASTGTYTPIAPRQELTPAPSALVSAAAPWTGVAGKPAGFADDVDDDVVGGLACASGQVAKWNGTAWACASDLVNAGTVTSVGAGAGLSGGPITSSGTLSVAFGGGGAASTVARSDHQHHGQLWSGASGTGLTVESALNGVYGHATAASGATRGLYGLSDSSVGTGVYGEAAEIGVRGQSASTYGAGVLGYQTSLTGFTIGVIGRSESSDGNGTEGVALSPTGETRGVTGHAVSTQGIGVYGLASAGSGPNYGVFGKTASSLGVAVMGFATSSSGLTSGVRGETWSPNGIGLQGRALGGTGAIFGVHGLAVSSAGTGVYGEANSMAGSTAGVRGLSNSSQGRGVLGEAIAPTGVAIGVRGTSSSSSGYGVYGATTATTGPTVGIYGINNSSAGFAGYFSGRVHVAGTLSKAAGSFRIDHPLDPERKYLYHSFVESPDMKNVYDGVVTTDEAGLATITMPAWFEALNRDFRYQLTVIGRGEWARARVFREVEANTFVVQTDRPGITVSWQVTGIRRDAYAEKHRIPVEEDKPLDAQGHPLEPGGDPPIVEP